ISVGSLATVNTGTLASASGTTLSIATGGTVNSVYGTGTTTTFSGSIAGDNLGSNGTFNVSGAGTLVFNHTFSAGNVILALGGTSVGSGDTSTYLHLNLSNSASITFDTIIITGDTILDFS